MATEPEPNDATPFLPEKRNLGALRDAAQGCRGCHLWRHATQAAILRQRIDEERRAEREAFAADLRVVADVLAEAG